MQEVSAMILSDGLRYDGTTFVPIVTDLTGTRLFPRTPNPVSIVELGKKLLIAAKNGETEEVRELMAKGSPFTTDWLGTSPLHFAALNNHYETCEALLRAGISRDARTKVDRTPLHMAAYEGHCLVVELLINHGADVDAKDMLKMTPLHWAVQNEHLDIVDVLIKNGANPDIINKFEKTPADIAVDLNRMDILQKLQFISKDPLIMNDDEDIHHEVTHEIEESNNENSMNLNGDVLQCLNGQEEVLQEKEMLTEEPIVVNNIKYTNVNGFVNITKHINGSANLQESIDMSDSFNILKEHGISFLPNDESSIVASAVENGHSLVLTEVGKQVLNSTKPYVKLPVQKTTIPNKIKGRKVITLTAQQLLAMMGQKNGIVKKLPTGVVNISDKTTKKPIVMNKNKIIIGGITKIQKKTEPTSEIETVKQQLAEARKQIEEYKQMFKSKEAEAEKYKRQLQSLTQNKIN